MNMRLLKRDQDGRLTLINFRADAIPRYAILSHAWIDGEEITYDEFLDGLFLSRQKLGYIKIQFCGEQALRIFIGCPPGT